MRTRPRLACILVLTGLFAVLAAAPGLAADVPASHAPAASQAVSVSTADFLATLSASVPAVPAVASGTDCRSAGAHCPAPKLCCLACGYFGCDTYACFNPVNGHCPLFP